MPVLSPEQRDICAATLAWRNSTNLAMSVNIFIVNLDKRKINMIKLGSKRDNTVKTSSDLEFTY